MPGIFHVLERLVVAWLQKEFKWYSTFAGYQAAIIVLILGFQSIAFIYAGSIF